MSANKQDRVRAQRWFDEFLMPLAQAQSVCLQRPISPFFTSAFDASCHEAESFLAQWHEIRVRQPRVPPNLRLPAPGAATLRLVGAGHNLISLTDSSLGRMGSRRARGVIMTWVDELIDSTTPPRTRGETFTRHELVTRLLALKRKDTVIKNWAYTYRFRGRRVPGNVTALPKLRRVRVSSTIRDLGSLWTELDRTTALELTERAHALVVRSPLTHLLHPNLFPGEKIPPFRFTWASIAVLSDPTMRSLVARTLADYGIAPLADQLGRALESFAAHRPSPNLRYYLMTLLAEMLGYYALTVERTPGHPWWIPKTRHERVFAAFLSAISDGPDWLSRLVELDDPRQLIRRLTTHLATRVDDAAKRLASSVVDGARLSSGPAEDKRENAS